MSNAYAIRVTASLACGCRMRHDYYLKGEPQPGDTYKALVLVSASDAWEEFFTLGGPGHEHKGDEHVKVEARVRVLTAEEAREAQEMEEREGGTDEEDTDG